MLSPQRKAYIAKWRQENRERVNGYSRKWRLKNAEKVRRKRRQEYAKNGHKIRAVKRRRYRTDAEWAAKERARCRAYWPSYSKRHTSKAKAWRDQLREDIIKAYGGKCSCCGEREPIFLTLDHIFNDGAKARRKLAHKNGRPRGGVWQYADLRKKGFPKKRHRLLCWNCNCGRQRNGGVCPHKDRRKLKSSVAA